MTRTKTDEEILQEVAEEVRRMFGIVHVHKGRPKGATGTLTLWKADGKYYRHKKNAQTAGAPIKKLYLDAEFLLEDYEKNGFEYHCEDMTHDEYIKTVKQKVSEYHGERV